MEGDTRSDEKGIVSTKVDIDGLMGIDSDQNLFDIPIDDIDSTEVLTTVFNGEIVYTAN